MKLDVNVDEIKSKNNYFSLTIYYRNCLFNYEIIANIIIMGLFTPFNIVIILILFIKYIEQVQKTMKLKYVPNEQVNG